MKPRRNQSYDDRAEGTCMGIPYNTDLVSSEGVSIHFWLDTIDQLGKAFFTRLLAHARYQRDIVGVTYSVGQPSAFWAHEDF